MGFLNGLGRLIAGKPVFETPAPQGEVSDRLEPDVKQPPADPGKTPTDAHGNKIIPKLKVSNLRTRRDGNQMTTTVWITNTSNELVRIDSTSVANQKQVSGRELGPGQGYEFLVYRGPVQTSEQYSQAHIVYRLVRSDDLFQEEYFVEYNLESDGAYTLEELHEDGPTRDI